MENILNYLNSVEKMTIVLADGIYIDTFKIRFHSYLFYAQFLII